MNTSMRWSSSGHPILQPSTVSSSPSTRSCSSRSRFKSTCRSGWEARPSVRSAGSPNVATAGSLRHASLRGARDALASPSRASASSTSRPDRDLAPALRRAPGPDLTCRCRATEGRPRTERCAGAGERGRPPRRHRHGRERPARNERLSDRQPRCSAADERAYPTTSSGSTGSPRPLSPGSTILTRRAYRSCDLTMLPTTRPTPASSPHR